jgi:molybdate transport system substrate-binding protein
LSVVVAACASGGGRATSTAAPRSITVFAASSLANAFADEAAAFALQSHQQVTFSFAGSQELVAQINQGAPADVLATADQKTMARVAGATAKAKVFAHNKVVIVTAPGNPKHIATLADFAHRGLAVVLAAKTVPAGNYAATALAAAHVAVHPKSLEPDVRSVLTKVELGEADAGVVYASDAKAAGAKVSAVTIPQSPIASYPVAALHSDGQAFVEFLLSSTGQSILEKHGFLPAT